MKCKIKCLIPRIWDYRGQSGWFEVEGRLALMGGFPPRVFSPCSMLGSCCSWQMQCWKDGVSTKPLRGSSPQIPAPTTVPQGAHRQGFWVCR